TPLLVRDLLDAYAGAIAPPPQVPYADVVRALATRDLSAARAAWTDAMTGARPTLLFEGQAASPDVGEIEFALPAALDAALRARARERGLTVNTVMQGAWAALLATLTGRDDVVFGAPVSGRFGALAGIADHIGLFSNTVPVRLRLTPHEPLLRQLERLQAQQIALLEHDGLGLAEIQRLAHTNPLFDTLLVSENYPDDASLHARDYAGARLAGLRNRGYTHYPLTVLVLPGETLQLIVEYRDVVREPQRVVGRLLHLLQHLADDATTPWSRFDPRLADERALVDAVNATAHPVPATTLCALIAAQIARTPQATALQDIRDSLTYAQMDRQAGALAARLQAAGVRLGDIVAVALPRSVRLSVALLAVQRAGAAYLPLDTGYPDERLAYMVSDAQPRLLIATGDLAARFGAFAPVLLFDALAADDETAAPSLPALAPQHAAYLLYTSGSTGRPKGVLVSHEAIVNRLLWMQHEYALAADDTVLQKTPSSFDVSVWEFFWPLLVGARLFLAPPDAHRDPEELLRVIEAQRVTTLHFVPSMLAAFVAHLRTLPDATARCTDLRRVFCSGEALPRDLAQRWTPLQSAPLHNLYGPTEAAVDVTFKAAADDDAGTRVAASVPIGRPVWNTQLRILDAQLRPVPVGAPGELYLCGVQLADGYRGRAALTATRFVADPFGDGARMYRTGDIARWLGTGDVEYLGRCDDQLKIRGQRIELGEIEAVLTAQPGVAQAVVVARVIGVAGTDGDARQLVGYVVPRNAQAFDASTLRTALAQQLPAHMVPVAFVELAALPLSTSGKLDRQALPAPELHSSDAREPQTELERLIARAFAQVLERDTVAADADFFALGGHSLAAMRLAAELRRVLQRPVSVGQIMGAASVATLAALLSATDGAAAANAGFGEILSLRAGEGMPLVCIHPASGFAWQYAGLARYLPEGLPLIGLQSPRPDGAIAASADMDAVCERHLANLRRVQPQGPYRLLGYSLGGTVAHGIAARLRAAGETVAFLGLLDTYPPEGQDWSGPAEAEAQSEVEREQAQFLAAADTDDDALVQREKAAMFERIVANYQDAVRLLSQARTPKLAGDAVLFVATRTLPAGWDVRDSWAPYLDALHVHELDCAHEDLLDPQNLQAVGALLAQRLRDSGIG
ncbi:MAG TPA: amino acid adenylation domain-containing protein, partial [Tahibacter sp.]|uniref:amino acid adenylation domain-containing protein n=1 Tax=Tahibacter sp. TaxID=2056211 RepID=UPI002C4F7571